MLSWPIVRFRRQKSLAWVVLVLGATLLAPPAPAATCTRPADGGALPCAVVERGALARDPGAPLRVVTFNVHYGADVPALVRAVRENRRLHAADVLLLQEIEQHPGDDRPAALAGALGLSVVYAAARPAGNGTHGLAILSRLPLRDLEVVGLRQYDLVYGTRRRIALAATVEVEGQPLRIFNVHLDTRLAPEQRMNQLEPIAARASGLPRAIVGGDVNTINCVTSLLPALPLPLPGYEQGPLLDRFMRARGFAAPLDSAGATGPLGMRLDALYVKGVRVAGAGKEDTGSVSDHLPLWMDVALN
jgi:endonuclease/exonuclease/phosphatase family metal-dependent hydrolase